MADLQMMVECPRCKRVWWAYHDGGGTVECNCHLVCPDGDLPTDCSVAWTPFAGQLGYPTGLDNNPLDEGEHVLRNKWYCSTHDKYYYKDQVIIELDWDTWLSKRAPKKLRQSLGEY